MLTGQVMARPLSSPRKFATVIVIKLARMSWAECFNQSSQRCHALLWGHPCTVATHIGFNPSGVDQNTANAALCKIVDAALRMTMFTAALELQYRTSPAVYITHFAQILVRVMSFTQQADSIRLRRYRPGRGMFRVPKLMNPAATPGSIMFRM